jgi:hypothetical protein
VVVVFPRHIGVIVFLRYFFDFFVVKIFGKYNAVLAVVDRAAAIHLPVGAEIFLITYFCKTHFNLQ